MLRIAGVLDIRIALVLTLLTRSATNAICNYRDTSTSGASTSVSVLRGTSTRYFDILIAAVLRHPYRSTLLMRSATNEIIVSGEIQQLALHPPYTILRPFDDPLHTQSCVLDIHNPNTILRRCSRSMIHSIYSLASSRIPPLVLRSNSPPDLPRGRKEMCTGARELL